MPPSPAVTPSTRTHPWISHSSPTCRRKLRNLRRHPTLNQTLKIPQVLQVFLLLHVLRSGLACANTGVGGGPRATIGAGRRTRTSDADTQVASNRYWVALSLYVRVYVYVSPHTSVHTHTYVASLHTYIRMVRDVFIHKNTLFYNTAPTCRYIYESTDRLLGLAVTQCPPSTATQESCPDFTASFGLFTRSSSQFISLSLRQSVPLSPRYSHLSRVGAEPPKQDP